MVSFTAGGRRDFATFADILDKDFCARSSPSWLTFWFAAAFAVSRVGFLASARLDTPNCFFAASFTLLARKALTLEVFNALLVCWLAFFNAVFVAVVASFFAELKRFPNMDPPVIFYLYNWFRL